MLVQTGCARRYVVLAGCDRCALANKPTEELRYCDGNGRGERQNRSLSSRATARMRSCARCCRTLQREVIRPMHKIIFQRPGAIQLNRFTRANLTSRYLSFRCDLCCSTDGMAVGANSLRYFFLFTISKEPFDAAILVRASARCSISCPRSLRGSFGSLASPCGTH